MKTYLSKAAKAVAVVIHDPKVKRAERQFAVLIVVRLLIALGASAELVGILEKLGS